MAQLSAYVATVSDDEDALWLHQLADAEIDLPTSLGAGTVEVRTGYPAQGRVEIAVTGDVVAGATLRVRVPSWSPGSVVMGPDGVAHGAAADGYAVVPLAAGATYVLDVDLTPRLTRAHHRVDALRGTVAVERGPVVYCVEQADLPDGVEVDDLVLVSTAVRDGDDGTLTLRCGAVPAEDPLYGTAGAAADVVAEHDIPAIPFSRWGNRGAGAMRVWIPVR